MFVSLNDGQVSVLNLQVFFLLHILSSKGLTLYTVPCNSTEVAMFGYRICTETAGGMLRVWDFYLEESF